MNDSPKFGSDDVAIAERLRATFDAEAATLDVRRQGRPRPEVAPIGHTANTQIVNRPAASQRGWRRSVIPVAAALVVMLGLWGVARLAQSNGGSEFVAPDESGLPVAAAPPVLAEDSAPADGSVAAIQPDNSADAQVLPPPTVAPGSGGSNLAAGSSDHGNAVTAINEVCVTGIVAPDTLNVRAQPTVDADLLGELRPGQCEIMAMVNTTNGWTLVRSGDPANAEIEGWVSSRYISPADGATSLGSAPEYCVAGIVAPDTLTLRTGPSVDARAVATLKPDRCGLANLGPATAGWRPVQVKAPDGSLYVGYVSAQFLEPATSGTWGQFEPNLVDPPWCAVSGQADAGVTLRFGPSTASAIVADLAPSECQVYPSADTDATGQWTRVSVGSINRGGWLPTESLRTTESFMVFDPGTPSAAVRFELQAPPGASGSVNPSHFRAMTTTGITIGMLDQDGFITVPADVDPQSLILMGYLTDKFCMTTGMPAAPIDGNFLVALLPELCV